MRLSFGQELRLVQKQVLAPRMIQSMEILQLPMMALQERIEQEMQENEALELVEEDPDLPDEEVEAPNPDAPTPEERELVVDETKDNEADFERLLNMDEEWPDHFEERSRPSATRVAEEGDRQHDAMANMVDRPQSLHEYLHDQLGWFDLEESLRQMCDRIIYSLDSNGYLQGRLEDLVDSAGGPAALTLAQKALATVQKLDPPGVGAHDLRECLLLQLKPNMPHYEQLKTLISNHLEDLEHNRLPQIERRTGYSIELIKQTLDELRKLNPKPGANFSSGLVPSVTPDVYIELNESGQYKVRLEDGRTPNLFISPYYRQLLTSPDTDEKTREYIKRKINSAQWLIESIEQRRNTLTRVAQAIVDHQTEFLNKGPEHIEPLKMQQIADKVGRARDDGQPGRGRQMGADPPWDIPPQTVLRRRHGQRRRRRGRVGRRANQAARNRRQREQATSLQRRRAGQRVGQARSDRRPADCDQIPQGDEDPQLPPAPRLGPRRRRPSSCRRQRRRARRRG